MTIRKSINKWLCDHEYKRINAGVVALDGKACRSYFECVKCGKVILEDEHHQEDLK